MSSETFDDMHDRPEEFSEFAALPLETCRSIAALYDTTDRAALKFQRSHIRLTRGAASFGTLAVIAAIFGLSRFWVLWVSEKQLATAELTVVLFAFSFAVYGLATSQKYKWLARRHQAELYRQLKFRFLIRPAVWQDADGLSQEKKKIESYSDKNSLKDGIEDALPHGPFPITEEQLPLQTFEQLVQYYMKSRLRPQMLYLDHRAQRNEYKDRFLAFLPAGLFFASVAAAAAHSGFSYFSKQVAEQPLSWAIVAALLAACLPVTGAWVRTVRAAFEYSRNKSRSIAAHRALRELEDLLVRDSMVTVQGDGTPRSYVDPRHVLKELWWCEQIFATEHREWLRLMVETEWYG
jgi:hypothetical protein